MSPTIISLREIQFKKIKQILEYFEKDMKSLEEDLVAIKHILNTAAENREPFLHEQDVIDCNHHINNAHPFIAMFLGAISAVNIFLEKND